MNKIRVSALILICLLISVGQEAHAGLKDYTLGFPLETTYSIVGAYDLKYEEWLTGHSLDVLWLRRRDEDKPILYLAANHLFNLSHQGKGHFGGTIGIKSGKLGAHVENAANLLLPGQAKRFDWLHKASNWASLEVGGGYLTYGVPEGQTPWFYTIGGKVELPIEKLWGG